MAGSDTEVVYVARDPLEVSAVTGLLASAGIEARVRDMTVSPYPVTFGPLGEKHVLVRGEQARHARSVLDRARRDGFLPEHGLVVGKEPAG